MRRWRVFFGDGSSVVVAADDADEAVKVAFDHYRQRGVRAEMC
jgi:hypothetical protein